MTSESETEIWKGKRIVDIKIEMEEALKIGRIVYYSCVPRYVSRLLHHLKRIKALVGSDRPRQGSELLHAFANGCLAKTGEVVDSGGLFQAFGSKILNAWIFARELATADPEETVGELTAWLETDYYKIGFHIEEDLADIMRPEIVNRFVRIARNVLDALPPDDELEANSPRARWLHNLKILCYAQGDWEGYLQLCPAGKVGVIDCVRMAKIHQIQGERELALRWVERGIEYESNAGPGEDSEGKLRRLRIELLAELGCKRDVLDLLWGDFRRMPDHGLYQEIQALTHPKQRRVCHGRLIQITKESPFPQGVSLFIELGEIEALADYFNGASVDEIREARGELMVQAARALRRRYPGKAAEIYYITAMKILDRNKRDSYLRALRCLQHTRNYLLMAGMRENWDEIVHYIRRKHIRKISFMHKFERLAAGETVSEPAWLPYKVPKY
ncbi:MAG: hypothetical protein KJ970_19310 [Candidatus Eisenbacteria bacterium]|uniref:Uncharacterized protein n=1 Tax=Eiseniibacteriota bacterium TaxID=2212470 RepID=A0A948W894_UNCEI|nr:hypothetical protein [Candidatus Eisenbacteria bacterium]MBU1949734.1 hypothetical protein [Candidatus Eisenbacteria bacterium]MBU2693070.1 hypothetical protein [Candidatus Eisenbacteria bacterium]